MPSATHEHPEDPDASGSTGSTERPHADPAGPQRRWPLDRPWVDTAGTWLPWIVVALMVAVVAATWWPTFWLPFGDSRDGTLLGAQALRVRNFWELGLIGSSWVADTGPYMGNYAHHPPLPNFAYVAVTGVVGQGEEQMRLFPYLSGLATIPFAAMAMRSLKLRWAPILVALALMIATDFFWVYARVLRGFTPVLLLVAAIAYLREHPDPPRWLVWGTALTGALTAAWSWQGAFAAAGLGLWLFAARRFDRPTLLVGAGMLLGFLLSAAWVVGISGFGAMVNQAEFRTTGGGFTTEEFVRRQLRFARDLLPSWYLVLLGPAVLAGLWHRRTRIAVLVLTAVTVGWGVGLPNGAFIHDYWNFWLLAPAAVGTAALLDLLRTHAPRLPGIAAIAGVGAIALVGFVGITTSDTQARYYTDPADAGSLVEAHDPPASQGVAWFTGGISTPRWLSWYWDRPARTADPERVPDAGDEHLVLVRLDRLPGFVDPEITDHLVAREGHYGLVRGETLKRLTTPERA